MRLYNDGMRRVWIVISDLVLYASSAGMVRRWWPALLGVAIVWGGVALSEITNPTAAIFTIAFAALIAWLIGRLRNQWRT